MDTKVLEERSPSESPLGIVTVALCAWILCREG